MRLFQSDVKVWLKKEGIEFLEKLNIEEGQLVIEFGCNRGNYTYPLAQKVGVDGLVFAFDKEEDRLEKIRKTCKKRNFPNIRTLNTQGSIKLPLDIQYVNKIDSIFAFDVIHYFEATERTELYTEFKKWLAPRGLLYVYPKHNANDSPTWSLADLTVSDVIEEIEHAGFHNISKKEYKLFHDNNFDEGPVLIFKR